MITKYDQFIEDAALEFLPIKDWRLFKAQLFKESGLNPDVESYAGAKGVGQFMPRTWDYRCSKLGYNPDDITDPIASIRMSALYMKDLYNKWTAPRPFMDRWCLALASYNAGMGNILDAQEISGNKNLYRPIMSELHRVTGSSNSAQTRKYVIKILDYFTDDILLGEYDD